MAEKPGFDLTADKHDLAEKAATDEQLLAAVVDALAGEDRGARQTAADVVHEVAMHHPRLLVPYASELADALHRPESQTRWEVLGVFERLVGVDARLVDRALPGAEAALHDEESGVVRLAAFRLLCAYGSTTQKRSERIWPLVDEAIRCYHGDPEFSAMLASVFRLTSGNSSDAVKLAAAERLAFDAENRKGLIGRRARQIVDCAPKKRGKKQ